MDGRRRLTQMAWVGVVALLGGWAAGLGAQAQPQPGTAAQPPGTVLVGRGVEGSGDVPVPYAQVIVLTRRPPTAAPATAGAMTTVVLQTGADGRFVVRDAPPTLALNVEAPGFLPVRNRSHVVAPGTKVSDITVRMTRAARLKGRVTDDHGDPMPRLAVQVWRRGYQRGQPRWTNALTLGLQATDDRGMYMVDGLAPGDYLVGIVQVQTSTPAAAQNKLMDALISGAPDQAMTALSSALTDAPMVSAGVRINDYLVSSSRGVMPVGAGPARWLVVPNTWYPSARTMATAQVVTLTEGEVREGIDLSLSLVPTVAVSGVVVGPSGPMAGAGVRLRAMGDAPGETGSDVAHTATRADGTFLFPVVPAGTYVASVVRTPPATASLPRNDGADRTVLFAETMVAVEKPVTDLVLTVAAPPRVRGRVTAADPAVTAFSGLQVIVSPLDQAGVINRAMTQPSAVGADGTFDVPAGPPGRYVLSVSGTTQAGWFAREADWQGRNVLHQAFRIESSDINGITVRLVQKTSAITGTVTGTGESTVVAFPEDWRAWVADGMSPSLVRQVRTSETGAFTLANVVPGTYAMVAVNPDVVGDVQDPTVIEALARRAISASVGDGETRTVSLKRVEGR